SPRRRGPIRRVREVSSFPSRRQVCPSVQATPTNPQQSFRSSSNEETTQITPFRIVFFDKANLPVAIPFLQALFAYDCCLWIVDGLDMDQSINPISAGEGRHGA